MALLLAVRCWDASTAGPDTSKGRQSLTNWFPRATGDAVHDVYYFEDIGWTDHPVYMRFDTHDTTIVREFIAKGRGGEALHADTTRIYGLTDGFPRWFHPSRDAQALRDSAGFYYLWVSQDRHRVWFFFADH